MWLRTNLLNVKQSSRTAKNKQTNKKPLLVRDIDMNQYIVVSKFSCSILLGCVRKHVGTRALLSWMSLRKFWIYNNMTFQKPPSFLFSQPPNWIEHCSPLSVNKTYSYSLSCIILYGWSTVVNVVWQPAAFEEVLQKSGANGIKPGAAWFLVRVFA